jgi:hypothetical protein
MVHEGPQKLTCLVSQGNGEASHGPLARAEWLMEAKKQPISAPGCGFPPQGLRLLGWYDPCQSQQLVEKSARFLCRALKNQTLRLSV